MPEIKSGTTASAGLKALGFDEGKKQDFIFLTFPAESSLDLPD